MVKWVCAIRFLENDKTVQSRNQKGQKIQPATRSSWKTDLMPTARAKLNIGRTFSTEEYERIKLGLVPQEMEDKWFILLESDWLYFHRSWTGFCIYQLQFVLKPEGYSIAEAWVNRDTAQYQNTDDEHDQALTIYLIDHLLLGKKDTAFPYTNNRPKGDTGELYRWGVEGLARSNDDEPPSF